MAAFSPESFQSAMKKPIGGAPAAAPKPAPALDLDSLMGEPGGEEMEGEGPEHEGGESSLEEALEKAGFNASPDQISKIKEILGAAGGAVPMMGMGMGGEEPPPAPAAPPTPSKPKSRLGAMLGK
jgi:hypothetical protein